MNFMLMNSHPQKLQNNQNAINNVMDRVRELPCEMNYMRDSNNFNDAQSMRRGQLSHVPSGSPSFHHQDERRDYLGRAKIMPPSFQNTPFTLGNVFSNVHPHILRHPVKGYPLHGTIQVQEEFLRGLVRCNL